MIRLPTPSTSSSGGGGRGDSVQQPPSQSGSYQQAPTTDEQHQLATDATQTDDGGYLTWEERFGGMLSTRQSRMILVSQLVNRSIRFGRPGLKVWELFTQ